MRCPKCGYISFDHLDVCRKCKKDISEKVDVVGTTYYAESPSFLVIPEDSAEPEDEMMAAGYEGQVTDESEYVDPDLEVLDEEEEVFFEEDDGEEIAMDFDSMEGLSEKTSSSPGFRVPEELSDISDLAPPDRDAAITDEVADNVDLDFHMQDNLASLDDELDLGALDLDFGSSGDGTDSEDLSVSLDDIDLSAEDLVEGDSDLDGLSLDFDLGGEVATLSKKPDSNKVDSSLDGISLSLD